MCVCVCVCVTKSRGCYRRLLVGLALPNHSLSTVVVVVVVVLVVVLVVVVVVVVVVIIIIIIMSDRLITLVTVRRSDVLHYVSKKRAKFDKL